MKSIADLLFESATTVEQIESQYPTRTLPREANVTRFAPSPTGLMHIGGLYAALISHRIAKQSGGRFILRIEDTDKAREIAGAKAKIVMSLHQFGIDPDEGFIYPCGELGEYGPYQQSERRHIYLAFAKDLLRRGLAYPCFATPAELDAMHEDQMKRKVTTGYHGQWAPWRNKSDVEVHETIAKSHQWVLRLRSIGEESRKIAFDDQVKGAVEMRQNHLDVVLIKSDGLPTYHFAHVVDDHLMRVTDAIRGDEWLASVPLHLELFAAMGWAPPRYGHIAPIQKLEGAARRKLSKRKDDEADVAYYMEAGYPPEAVIEYLSTLADSGFEPWRAATPQASCLEYRLSLDRLNTSGALLDLTKLQNVSREIISAMSPAAALAAAIEWASDFNQLFYAVLTRDTEYSLQVFASQRPEGSRIRKDLAAWSEIQVALGFYFDELFGENALAALPSETNQTVLDAIGDVAGALHDSFPTNRMQFLELVNCAATNHRLGKKAPSPGDEAPYSIFMKTLRILLTGKAASPDLWDVIRVIGPHRSVARLNVFRRL